MPRNPSRQQPQPTLQQRKPRPEPPASIYTPPAGFPADPREFLAYLQAGQFTAQQAAYLRSNALTQYVAAINSARGMPGLVEAVTLGDQIIAAWLAALAGLGPAPAANPFQIAP